jgi:two-component system, sensor histidine kinase LadS
MRVVFLALFVFCLIGRAAPVLVDENLTSINALGLIYEDKSGKLTIDEVLEQNPFKPNLLSSFKYTSSALWTKMEVKNVTNKDMPVAFKNERPGMDFVDAYIYEDGELIKTYLLGDMRKQSLRETLYRYSAFTMTIHPNKKYTIVTRLKNTGVLYTAWSVMSIKRFTYNDTLDSMIWGLFGGFIIALIIYNLSVSISFKEAVFVVYIINALVSLWFYYGLNGVLYWLDVGLSLEFITYGTWIAPNLGLAALTLFPLFFFKLYENYKTLNAILILFAALSFGMALVFSYAFVDATILRYASLTAPFSMALLLLLFGIGIWAYKKRLVGSGYYLLGQGIYLLFVLYNAGVLMGYSQIKEYSHLTMPAGVIFDIVFLSLALSQKIKHVQLENERNTKLLIEQARFSSIGQAIGSVAHQWKNPISHLSTQIMLLEGVLKFQRERLTRAFEESLPQINDSIKYMKDSVNEFYDFYSGGAEKIDFSPSKEIAIALKILDSQIILQNIEVVIKKDDALVVYGFKNSFLNVIMVLIENAVYELTAKDIQNGKIEISIEKKGDMLELIVSDNAGGIAVRPIEKIFEPNYSSKKTQGCGLGLSVAKMIVEEKFNGKLEAKNIGGGAWFRATMSCDLSMSPLF